MKNKDLAKAVLAKYWDGGIPVKPEAIARGLGIMVFEDPYLQYSGTCGFENGVPVIRYNLSEPPVRQRFTIAHELGHYVLGHASGDSVCRDPKQNFSASNYDPQEVAANRFAAEILMPESKVNALIQRYDVSEIATMARTFQVSEIAMQYRLKNLGWLK